MVGVDTGFFFALSEGHPLAEKVFRESDISVSVLTQFELRRISLRRGIPWEDMSGPLSRSAAFLDVTGEAADEAARISFGAGMPALDALILACLVKAGRTFHEIHREGRRDHSPRLKAASGSLRTIRQRSSESFLPCPAIISLDGEGVRWRRAADWGRDRKQPEDAEPDGRRREGAWAGFEK